MIVIAIVKEWRMRIQQKLFYDPQETLLYLFTTLGHDQPIPTYCCSDITGDLRIRFLSLH